MHEYIDREAVDKKKRREEKEEEKKRREKMRRVEVEEETKECCVFVGVFVCVCSILCSIAQLYNVCVCV